jgi:thiol:disulfide interchange protein
MKFFRTVLLLVGMLSCILSFAQDSTGLNPVTDWKFSQVSHKGNVYVIRVQADVASGWKVFSSTMKDDEPNLRLSFDSSSEVSASVTSMKEAGTLHAKEPALDNQEIGFLQNKIDLEVTVTLKSPLKKLIGEVNYMAIRGSDVFGPEDQPFRFEIDKSGDLVNKKGGLQENPEQAAKLVKSSIKLDSPVNNCGGTGAESAKSGGLLSLFFIGFAGGLIALFTPCVFPMIPLTVSFFTKRAQSRKKGLVNAGLYSFFIVLIYVILSLPFHFLDSLNPEILNNISTNVWLNLIFFVIFIAFALSFFGLYEITLPSALSNTADSKSGITGLSGIFFMALTLALVSFSCTGPILGSLLAGSLSTNGGATQLTVGMGGFGLALALPFGLFALFPNWLNSLPKSGGWLSTIKIVLGFLELALAIKFLSNADLVMHWGILPREVFFAAWIIIGIALVLYLFNVIRFSHEGPVKMTRGRIFTGVVFLAMVIYLIPGLTKTKYANRSLISGFPPPLHYSIYGKEAFKGVEANVMNDYDKALALSKAQNKPLLIDFTGWACVNCRKMEENVWTNPEIKDLIEQKYILVSLYVDDRKKLPVDEQFMFIRANNEKKEIITVGDKYETFQSVNFINAAQPLYAVISPDEKLLTLPVGYTPSVEKYKEWLNCGLDAYKTSSTALK